MTLQRIKEKAWLQIFIIYTRYLIGGAFVFASLVKIQGNRFTAESGAGNPINSAWHFFETLYQSGLYWHFIGVGQFIAGGLLMTQRYAKFGAVVFFPIILNIFVITISYHFAGTPLITGGMLLTTIFLLLWEWDTLKTLFNLPPDLPTKERLENDKIWTITGITMFLFTAIYRICINPYNLFLWGGICVVLGAIGLVVGLKKNNNKQVMG